DVPQLLLRVDDALAAVAGVMNHKTWPSALKKKSSPPPAVKSAAPKQQLHPTAAKATATRRASQFSFRRQNFAGHRQNALDFGPAPRSARSHSNKQQGLPDQSSPRVGGGDQRRTSTLPFAWGTNA